MILYRPRRGYPVSEFGIDIPSSPNKAAKLLEVVRNHDVLGPLEKKWLIGDDNVEITKEDILRTHSPEYVEKLFSDQVEEVLIQVFELIDSEGNYHRYDPSKAKRPLSQLFDRSLWGLAGTYQACRTGISSGFCFYLSGGGHHAHRDFGHGFCVLNDILIAIHKMQAEKLAGRVWIIDVPVESGEEHLYNKKLTEALERLSGYPRPDFAFIQLGVDCYEKDGLPSTDPLNLTLEQLNERNALIYQFIEERKIPATYIMSGGYGPHAWEPYPDFVIRALLDRLN
jgi:acetoin utilization deacetylase AcuC-like enzyme